MNKVDFSEQEQIIIKECLNAVVNGPFIPDWEFHTLFGLDKGEVESILNKWPIVNRDEINVQIAINNTLNNLIGYPIDNKERWNEFISISREELYKLVNEWFKPDAAGSDGENYFRRLM